VKNKEFIEQLKQNQEKDLQTLKNKNNDYGDSEDPFHNFRMVEDSGLMTVEKGIAVRMSDKMQRVMNLLQKKEADVDDETLEDTLSDLRNYANILQTFIQQKDSEPEHKYVVQPVFEGVKQSKLYVDEEEPFTPMELPNGEDWFCYIEEQ